MITENYKTLVPAYGREYKNQDEAKADFLAGKDFDLLGFDSGGYCSIRDFAKGVHVHLWYKKMTKICVVIV